MGSDDPRAERESQVMGKVYNLYRGYFETDISVVLTVKRGPIFLFD
jgi:hypothetical protein